MKKIVSSLWLGLWAIFTFASHAGADTLERVGSFDMVYFGPTPVKFDRVRMMVDRERVNDAVRSSATCKEMIIPGRFTAYCTASIRIHLPPGLRVDDITYPSAREGFSSVQIIPERSELVLGAASSLATWDALSELLQRVSEVLRDADGKGFRVDFTSPSNDSTIGNDTIVIAEKP